MAKREDEREIGTYSDMEENVSKSAAHITIFFGLICLLTIITTVVKFLDEVDEELLDEIIDSLMNKEAVEDVADVSVRDFNEVDHPAIRSSLTSLGNGDFVAAFGDAVLINPHVNGGQLDAEHILVSGAGQWYEYTSRAGQSECTISYNPAQEFERACVVGAVEMSPELRTAACAAADNLRTRETSLTLNEHAQGFLARHCG